MEGQACIGCAKIAVRACYEVSPLCLLAYMHAAHHIASALVYIQQVPTACHSPHISTHVRAEHKQLQQQQAQLTVPLLVILGKPLYTLCLQ